MRAHRLVLSHRVNQRVAGAGVLDEEPADPGREWPEVARWPERGDNRADQHQSDRKDLFGSRRGAAASTTTIRRYSSAHEQTSRGGLACRSFP